MARERDREKQRAYMRVYNEKHREESRQKGREYYQKHAAEQRASARAYRKANPEKVKAAMASWRERNKERITVQNRLKPRDPGQMRESRIRRKYGLTPELEQRFLREQHNACAICRRSFDELEIHIDHQHGGDVRGLLCTNCNSGLGQFRDDISALAAAIAYLNEPPAKGLLTPQLRLFEEPA